MPKLKEESLQLMEAVINANITEDGDTKMSKYSIEIAKLNKHEFQPPFWGGFNSPLAQIKAYPNRFGFMYRDANKTDCRIWVRDSSNNKDVISQHFAIKDEKITESKEIVETLFSPDDFIKYFTEDLFLQWKEKAKLTDGMDNYEICKNVLFYRYQKAIKENKVFRINNCIAFNTGETGGEGYDPYYLVFGEKSDGFALNIYNRYELSGRYLLSLLNNNELQRVEFKVDIFDYSRPLEIEYGHILEGHPERLPEELMAILKSRFRNDEIKNINNQELVNKYKPCLTINIMGAVEYLRRQLQNRSVMPVPFWYKKMDKSGWLLPLQTGLGDSANLALVLQDSELNGKPVYWGKTVISLKQAFMNARLLGKVTADWLKYEKVFKDKNS